MTVREAGNLDTQCDGGFYSQRSFFLDQFQFFFFLLLQQLGAILSCFRLFCTSLTIECSHVNRWRARV